LKVNFYFLWVNVVLNSKPEDDDFNFQFQGLMSESIKGRSNLLNVKSLNTTGLKTGSTVTSENT